MSTTEHHTATPTQITGAPHIKTEQPDGRRPLGDVSPNIRHGISTPGLREGKPKPSGSSLKRSITAAMSDGQGLRYLKKRRLSSETPLSLAFAQPRSSLLSTTLMRDERSSTEESEVQLPVVPHIHESAPTEPNSSIASNDDNDKDRDDEGAQGSSGSFSDLINYDPSSQASASGTQTQTHQRPQEADPSNQKPQHDQRVVVHPSMATILRLRLQIAMYKVRTNQIDTPFEDLQVESDRLHHVAGLLPAPVLRPTPYGRRQMMYSDASMPPSPYVLGGRGSSVATPIKSWTDRGNLDETELTSSIVKEGVAKGLLGLRNAKM